MARIPVYDNNGNLIGYRESDQGNMVMTISDPNKPPEPEKPSIASQIGKIGTNYLKKKATNYAMNEAGKQLGLTTAKKAGTQAGTQAGTEGLTSVLPYAKAAAGAYGLYNLLSDDSYFKRKATGTKLGMNAAQGAASGAAIGSAVPGVGTVIGAGIGGAIGLASNFFGGAKHKDQYARDDIRGVLKENGFLNKDSSLTLSDGTTFDMGKDGGFKYADGFRAYEVDHDDDVQSAVFGTALPIAQMLTGGDAKLTSDYAGYLTRAAIQSNATSIQGGRDSLLNIVKGLGLTQEDIYKYSQKAKEDGKIDEQQQIYNQTASNILFNNANGLNIGATPTAQPQPQQTESQPQPQPLTRPTIQTDEREQFRVFPQTVAPSVKRGIDWSKLYSNETLAGSLLR